MGAVQQLIHTLRKPREIDEGRARERASRADHAERLLRDETLQKAFAEIEETYMSAWRGSSALDVELRERAHIAVLLLNDLKSQLISYVRDGVVARDELEKSLRR